MARARSLFFGFLAAAMALFASWKRVSASPHEIGSAMALVAPCLFVGAVACAAAAWGTAVMVASVHRVTWPLVTAVGAVVAGLAVGFWFSIRPTGSKPAGDRAGRRPPRAARRARRAR